MHGIVDISTNFADLNSLLFRAILGAFRVRVRRRWRRSINEMAPPSSSPSSSSSSQIVIGRYFSDFLDMKNPREKWHTAVTARTPS